MKIPINLFRAAVLTLSILKVAVSHAILPTEITVSLSHVETIIAHEGEILVNVSYTNNSDDEVRFLKRGSALEGAVREDIFNIQIDGQYLSYIGPTYKRLPPTEVDYVTLGAGETTSIIIRLDQAYSLVSPGTYVISYRNPHRKTKERSSSNTIRVDVLQERATQKLPSNFQGCSGIEQQRLNSALSVAETFAARARNDLNLTPIQLRTKADRYKEWFGAYNSSRWKKVQDNFSRIYSAASGKSITFNCECSEGDDRTLAYVYRSRAYQIYICPLFWSRPTSRGADSRAGIIVHELSHFSVVANTQDHVYGVTGNMDLARSSPNKAVENADSYEYFAENPTGKSMPNSRPPTPTRPETPGAPVNPSTDDQQDPGPIIEPAPEPEVGFEYLPAVYSLLLDSVDNHSPTNTEPEPIIAPEWPQGVKGNFLFRVSGSKADPRTQGQLLSYTEENSNAEISIGDHSLYFSVSGLTSSDDGPRLDNWQLTTYYPTNNPITTGVYKSNFSIGHGGSENCDIKSQRITIYQLEINKETTEVNKLIMSFKFMCSNNEETLNGTIFYNRARTRFITDHSTQKPPHALPTFPELSRSGWHVSLSDRQVYSSDTQNSFSYSNKSGYLKSQVLFDRENRPHPTINGMKIDFGDTQNSWELGFSKGRFLSDRHLRSPILPGFYDHAVNLSPPYSRHTYFSANYLSLSKNGAECKKSIGWFSLEQFADPNSRELQLKLNFELQCENSENSISGTIHIDGSLPKEEIPQIALSSRLTPQQTPLQYAGTRIMLDMNDDGVVDKTYKVEDSNIIFRVSPADPSTGKTGASIFIHSAGFTLSLHESFISQTQLEDLFVEGVYSNLWRTNYHEFSPTISKHTPFQAYASIGSSSDPCQDPKQLEIRIFDISFNPNSKTVERLKMDLRYHCSANNKTVRASVVHDSTLHQYQVPFDASTNGVLSPAISEASFNKTRIRIAQGASVENSYVSTSNHTSVNIDSTDRKTGFYILFNQDKDNLYTGTTHLGFRRGNLNADPLRDSELTVGTYHKTHDLGGVRFLRNSAFTCESISSSTTQIHQISYNDLGNIASLIADFDITCAGPVDPIKIAIKHNAM